MERIASLLEANSGRLITVEDHQLVAGAGSILAQALLLKGQKFQLKSIGNRGEFGRSAYKADELYRSRDMDEQTIVQAFLNF